MQNLLLSAEQIVAPHLCGAFLFSNLNTHHYFFRNLFNRTRVGTAQCPRCPRKNGESAYRSSGLDTINIDPDTIGKMTSGNFAEKYITMEIIFKYYGLDWLSMILSICAMILLGNKAKGGFIFFILANITMMAVSYFLLQSLALFLGNLIFLVTNFRGFKKWNAE
jgi:hypothetical protein